MRLTVNKSLDFIFQIEKTFVHELKATEKDFLFGGERFKSEEKH